MVPVFHTNMHVSDPWHFPKHKHDLGELIYFLSGNIHITVNGKELVSQPNQMLYLPPNTIHEEISDQSAATIWLLTSVPLKNIPPCTLVDDLKNKALLHLISTIYKEYKQVPLRDRNIFFKYIELLDLYFYQFTSTKINPIVNQMCQILENNLSNASFNIHKGFAELGYSIDYLRTLFRKYMGTTPKDYLLHCRLDRACQLLVSSRQNDLLIKDVALRCGFSDALYFSRTFHSKIGVTPSEYMHYTDKDQSDSEPLIVPSFFSPNLSEIPCLYPIYSERNDTLLIIPEQ